MQNDVLVIGDEKGARRQGNSLRRAMGGDAVVVTDSIEVELTPGGILIDVLIGGSAQPADSLDLDTEVHTKQPTLNRRDVAVSVCFTEAAATQLVTVAFYVQNLVTGTIDLLFSEELTSTAATSTKGGLFMGNPLTFPTRGATLFEVRRAAPSAGQTEVRAWPF